MSSAKAYFDERSDGFWCKLCLQMLSVQPSRTTSHLWTHLQLKHKAQYEQAKEINSQKQQAKRALTSYAAGSEPSTSKKSRRESKSVSDLTKDRYDKAVLYFVVADARPLETAAGVGFKHLCSEFTDGRYCPPHPTTLSRRLDDMKDHLEVKLRSTLKSDINTSRISVTFDHWKGDNGSNFLALTVHYISETNWNLFSRCLSVINLEDRNADHTAATTEDIIKNQLEYFGIELPMVLFATTDTTNTMPCTARRLGMKWHGCSAHVLQLAINAALDAQIMVKHLIKGAHRIGGFFHSSTVGQSALTKHQMDSGLSDSRPPLDVITRFNSTFKLLDWLHKNEVAVSLALIECQAKKRCFKGPPASLSKQLKDTLDASLPILKIIAEATTMLSADSHVSVSLIIPCISVLKEEVLKAPSRGIQSFKDELLKQLNSRFDLSMDYLLVSTFLVPRFKKVLFDDTQTKEIKRYLENVILNLNGTSNDEALPDHIATRDTLQDNTSDDSRTLSHGSLSGGSLLDCIFQKVNLNHQSVSSNEKTASHQLNDEIFAYSREPIMDRNGDPLLYWGLKCSIYPLLAKAARDILSIQATNCASERVNSVGSQVLTDSRHSLSNHNAETLIWAKKNKDLMFS